MPIISIIVPVYNAKLYLNECIDSIISQSFKDYELILINDGSTDESLNICREYQKSNHNIIVIDGENKGVSAARNKGLDIAEGEWITFVDADDYLLPNALKILYERVISTGTDIVLANAVKLKDGSFSLLRKLPNEVLPNIISSIKHFAVWGYLFRSVIIKNNNIRFIEGLAYSEDRIFIYQLARYSKVIAYSNTPIYVYRVNPYSACSSSNSVRKACHHLVAAYHLKNLSIYYAESDKVVYKVLKNESHHVIKLGLHLFSQYHISKSDFYKVKSLYRQLFGKKIKTTFRFYFDFVIQNLTCIRRKILTIRKSKKYEI